MKSYILVVLFVILLCTEAAIVHGDGHNGNEGNGNNNNKKKDNANNGNGKNKGDDKGKNKDKGDKKKKYDDELDYDNLSPSASGQERAYCKGKGACYQKTLVCPSQCPERKPKKNKKLKGCHVRCGSKCEATCKCKPILNHAYPFLLFLIIYI